MKNEILFFAIIIFFVEENFAHDYVKQSIDITKIMQLIKNNQQKLKMLESNCSQIASKAVLALGLSGSGKSTLINYLNGVPLISRRKGLNWILEPESNQNLLPCGFSIGHGGNAHTAIPSWYNFNGSEYSYIDTPGFSDNRGLEIDVANTFAIKQTIRSVKSLKFLVLIFYDDLNERGEKFRNTLRRFSDFLGIFEDKNLHNLDKSIGLLVSRVNNEGLADLEIKNELKLKILEYLNNGKNNSLIRENEFFVFEKAVSNDQIEIFSNPRENGKKLDNFQKDKILSMLDRLDYIDKDLIKMQTRIDDSHYSVFKNSLNFYFEKLKLQIQGFLTVFFENLLETITSCGDLELKMNMLRNLISSEKQFKNLDQFIKQYKEIFGETSDEFKRIKEQIEFLSIVLPDKDEFFDRNFIDSSFLKLLNDKNHDLQNFYNDNKASYDPAHGIFKFKGHFVKISHILDIISDYRGLEKVIIYSTNCVTFDSDYKLPAEVYSSNGPDLIIISPKVINERPIKIDLTSLLIPDFPDGKEKADDGTEFDKNGEDGKPGLPGYNGGNLFIISDEIINASNINFISNSGRAGPGQHGGNGKNGKNGRNASHSDIKYHRDFLEEKVKKHLSCPWNFKEDGHLWMKSFALDGEYGEPGGNGGKGGLGGKMGKPGKIILTELLNLKQNYPFTSQQKVENKDGINGKPGKEGIGGLQGLQAYREYHACYQAGFYRFNSNIGFGIFTLGLYTIYNEVSHQIDYYQINYNEDRFRQQSRYENYLIRNISGRTSNDLNKIGQIESVNSTVTNIYQIKSDYLDFFYQIKNNFAKSYQLTNKNFTIRLLKEKNKPDLEDVIERVARLNKLKTFSLKYELKEEIKNYINDQKGLNNQEKNVLVFLLATLSTIISENNSIKQPIFVVDIKNYIKTTLDQIVDWKGLVYQNIRNECKTNFEKNLKKKIKESKQLIEILKEDIDKNLKLFSLYINKTLIEIQDLKEDLDLNQQSLMKKKQQLEKYLNLKNFFAYLKIFTSIFLFSEKTAEAYVNIGEVILDNLEGSDTSKMSNYFKNLDFEINIQEYQDLKEILKNNTISLKEKNKTSDNEKEDIDELIDKTHKNLISLDKIEVFLEDFNTKYRKQFLTKTQEFVKNFNSSAKPNLEFNKWKIFNDLDPLKRQLSVLTNSFKNSAELKNIFNRVEHNLITLIEIYHEVENFYQQIEFAGYIYLVTQPNFSTEIPSEYRNKIEELKKKINSIVINERYLKAIEAFKYWSFPFFDEFNKNLNAFNQENNDISYKATVLKQILAIVEKNEYELDPKLDNYVQTINFDKKNPFYVWSYERNPLEIQSLLNGELTHLYANVTESLYNAIKFKMVYIIIEMKDSSQLNEFLKQNKIFVELTHSGESFYKINDEYFLINTNFYEGKKLTISYDYSCYTSDAVECGNMNNSFKKLNEKSPFLSPYTYWSIKLSVNPIQMNKTNIFERINSSINNDTLINVYLCGKGQYVETDYFKKSKTNGYLINNL